MYDVGTVSVVDILPVLFECYIVRFTPYTYSYHTGWYGMVGTGTVRNFNAQGEGRV